MIHSPESAVKWAVRTALCSLFPIRLIHALQCREDGLVGSMFVEPYAETLSTCNCKFRQMQIAVIATDLHLCQFAVATKTPYPANRVGGALMQTETTGFRKFSCSGLPDRLRLPQYPVHQMCQESSGEFASCRKKVRHSVPRPAWSAKHTCG